MRTPQHKPDSLVFLVVFVVIGLTITTIAQAEDYLFDPPTQQWQDPWSGYSPEHALYLSHTVMNDDEQHSWLLPGGMRTMFKGGMAHLQLDSPGNTRFALSMGLEENPSVVEADVGQKPEWYDRLQPTLFLSIGHHWE